jgi:HSP20 family protein
MNALIPWTSSPDLFRDRFDRLFSRMLQDLGSTATGEQVSTRQWVPAVDIQETADAVVLHAELPGLKREDVNITLENHMLTVSGERKFEKNTRADDFHRIERSYGSFARTFTLPTNVKTDKVEASFQDGVLTVKLPKVEEAKPRKIEIR